MDELEGPPLTPLGPELVGRLEVALFDAELDGSVMEMLRLSLLLGLGTAGDSEVETEGDTETSGVLEDGPVLGNEKLDTIALDIGPLADEDSVYGPPVDDVSVTDGMLLGAVPVLDGPEGVGLAGTELVVSADESSELPTLDGPELESAEDESDSVMDDARLDVTDARVVSKLLMVVAVVSREVTVTEESDGLLSTTVEELTGPLERLVTALDTMGNELIVQVSTLVVVRSVIWEVDEFVAIVVTTLVVIVIGRLGVRLAVLELPTDSSELESAEEAKLDVAADVGTLDNAVPEDGAAEEEAPVELWQRVSASCYVRGANINADLRLDSGVASDVDGSGNVLDKSAACPYTDH